MEFKLNNEDEMIKWQVLRFKIFHNNILTI